MSQPQPKDQADNSTNSKDDDNQKNKNPSTTATLVYKPPKGFLGTLHKVDQWFSKPF